MTRPFDPATDKLHDLYSTRPNRVRVYHDDEDGGGWYLDGIEVNGLGLVIGYTDRLWHFATWDEAMQAVPDFIREWPAFIEQAG